jgi:hypothetical protein
MHGFVHVLLKGFVQELAPKKWEDVLVAAGVGDAALLGMEQHDDALTLRVVKAACEVLDVPVDAAMDLFGAYFFDYVYAQGFSRLLRTLGSSFAVLLANLNTLHHNIERDIPAAIFPTLEVRAGGEGEPPGVVYLAYKSVRGGVLAPLLRGLLTKLAAVMFQQRLVISDARGTGESKSSWDWQCLPSDDRILWRLETVPLSVRHNDVDANTARFEDEGSTRTTSSKQCHRRRCFGFAVRRLPKLSLTRLHDALASCCSKSLTDTVVSPRIILEVEQEPILEKRRQVLRVLRESEPAYFSMESSEFAVTSRMPSKLNNKGLLAISHDTRVKLSRALFRAVPAPKVSAGWTDVPGLLRATEFWHSHEKLASLYGTHSSDAGAEIGVPVWFVSHCWMPPPEWEDVMGPECDYSEVKAAEVCITAKDIAGRLWGDCQRWEEVHLWVDKCCIPQADPQLRDYSIHLIEEFIRLSEGLVVQLSWNYFSRLWCVYEWACFLRSHDITEITVCVDPYLRDGSFALLGRSIREFRLDSCECMVSSDRAVLFAKVDSYYSSHAQFESLLKFSAICLVVRSLLERRHATSSVSALLQPWADMARDLEFDDLHVALQEVIAEVPEWRYSSIRHVQLNASTRSVHAAVNEQLSRWFDLAIKPLVHRCQTAAIRGSDNFPTRHPSKVFD